MEAWAETLPALNAIPELMPVGSAVSTGLFVRQSHILKKHHVVTHKKLLEIGVLKKFFVGLFLENQVK